MRLLLVSSLFCASVGYASDGWHGVAVGLACASGLELMLMLIRLGKEGF